MIDNSNREDEHHPQEEEAASPGLIFSDEDEPTATEHNTTQTNLEEEEDHHHQQQEDQSSSSTLATGYSDPNPRASTNNSGNNNNNRSKRDATPRMQRGKKCETTAASTTEEKKVDSSYSFEQQRRSDGNIEQQPRSNRGSPSGHSRTECNKPDPPPSVVGDDTMTHELYEFLNQGEEEESTTASSLGEGNAPPVVVVDATPCSSSWKQPPPPFVPSGWAQDQDQEPTTSLSQSQQNPPDPPPSVIDFEEQDDDRGFDDDDDMDGSLDAVIEQTEHSERAISTVLEMSPMTAGTKARNELIMEDENRLEGHILQAALGGAGSGAPQSMVMLNSDDGGGTQVHFITSSLPLHPTTPPAAVRMMNGSRNSSGSGNHPHHQHQHLIVSTEQELHTAVGRQHSFRTSASASSFSGQQTPHAILVQGSSFSGQQQHQQPPQQHQQQEAYSFRHQQEQQQQQQHFHQQQQFQQQQQQQLANQPIMVMQGTIAPPPPNGRRKIRLRMEEDPPLDFSPYDRGGENRTGFLKSIRDRSKIMFGRNNNKRENGGGGLLSPISETAGKSGTSAERQQQQQQEPAKQPIDRGTLTLSWFEGTSTLELQEHVRKSVARKLKLPKHIHLTDVRVLDISTDEEIVLSPFIPDGSEFLLRFGTRDTSKEAATDPKIVGPPDSPSAAPSPHPDLMGGLSPEQLKHLTKKLDALRTPGGGAGQPDATTSNTDDKKAAPPTPNSRRKKNMREQPQQQDKESTTVEEDSSDDDEMLLHSEDPIEARLRQITELLLLDREQAASKRNQDPPKHDKRQVIFVLANYFVLFLSLIAISAEIQARAPSWIEALESELKSVQNCAADRDALFECVSRGDFAGLIASVLLWLSRSVATRRVFLFGFESPKKLWTVVYECLVTSFCWGFSYMFIRRGMNPDTRERFLQKYWKDAVYGSLAGFNAAFMKQVLKNLIPQEAVEDALRDRQLKILSWLPKFSDH